MSDTIENIIYMVSEKGKTISTKIKRNCVSAIKE